jgi:hypothetical protein
MSVDRRDSARCCTLVALVVWSIWRGRYTAEFRVAVLDGGGEGLEGYTLLSGTIRGGRDGFLETTDGDS